MRDRIVCIRGQSVIIDADVAALYGVETKRINEAVRNNRDKFPVGYMFELNAAESQALRSQISTLEHSGRGKYSKYNYKAFTEKGLYMLATSVNIGKIKHTVKKIRKNPPPPRNRDTFPAVFLLSFKCEIRHPSPFGTLAPKSPELRNSP